MRFTNGDQFFRHLEMEKLHSVYGIFSDEPFLRIECEEAIRTAAGKQGFSEVIPCDLDAGDDPAMLEREMASISLFAQSQLFLLRMGAKKLNEKGAAAVVRWCGNGPEGMALAIFGPRPDSAMQRAAWFKAVEKGGGLLVRYRPEGNDWASWVSGRLRKEGVHMGKEAQHLLCLRTEGNMLAAAQAIGQLALLSGTAEVTVNDVASAVGDSAHYSVFDLSRAILESEPGHALAILNHLRWEGMEPILVLWVLARDARLLLALREGGNSQDLFRTHKVFGPQQGLFLTAARASRGLGPLKTALALAERADGAIKGQAAVSVWQVLAEMVVHLCGRRKGVSGAVRVVLKG